MSLRAARHHDGACRGSQPSLHPARSCVPRVPRSFNFPIVALPPAESVRLRGLAQSNAGPAGTYASFPQHAVHFDFYMGPDDLTSESCLDAQVRRRC